jgi:hypothetical protein
MTVSASRSRTQSTLLVPVVVATVASRCLASWMAYVPTPPELEAFVRFYLSPEHREQHADGCPSTALLDEIVRRPDATRQAFTDELLGVIGDIASRLDPTDVAAARTDALTVFGLMVGTFQVARALIGRDLSDQLLARGVQTALALLDDRASNAGVTREPRRALAASWARLSPRRSRVAYRRAARSQRSWRSRTASRTSRRISSERGVGPSARAIISAPTIALSVTVARRRAASSSPSSSRWRRAR